jgi:hypothetical protein
LGELLSQKDKEPSDLPEDFKRGGENLSAFFDKLAYGNWTSPDAFLEKHPEFIQTGKYLICRLLSRYEQPWGVVQNGGWYDKLVSAIHVDDPMKLKDNELSIVTFNYDRSIDFRLHKYVENRFGMPSYDAWQTLVKAIPIVHVHGSLDEYPRSAYGDQSSLWERGQKIKIISEVEENPPEFQYASELLNSAERVVVFGFGFATDNVRRLKFFRECENDDRDIIIASGNTLGTAHKKETAGWLSQWGLIEEEHYFQLDANRLFDIEVNPFA